MLASKETTKWTCKTLDQRQNVLQALLRDQFPAS